MKHDELSFLNLQLAGMLRDGIPLEGAIRQTVRTMQRGQLRGEFEKLEADLAAGVPLAEALAARKLPPFYIRMVQVGARSNDFPAVLTLLADYYQRSNLIWTRLKGLMIYPLILFGCSLVLSAWFAFLYSGLGSTFLTPFNEMYSGFHQTYGLTLREEHFQAMLNVWAAPVVFGIVFGLLACAIGIPSLRRRLRWRFPAFHDASLAQFAAAMHLLLKGGSTLNEASAMMAALETDSPAGRDLSRWQQRCAEGHARFADVADGSQVFPPLFIWLVAGAGEDLAAGFHRAAEVYQARASARTELMLYAAMPASLIFMGAMVAAQVYPWVTSLQKTLQPLFR